MSQTPPARVIGDSLPPCLAAWIEEQEHETAILLENGAQEVARARTILLTKLRDAAHEWRDTEIDVPEAARMVGCCQETIRRAVRTGRLPDRRDTKRGRHRLRRRDLEQLAGRPSGRYDPEADAQDIATRRTLP